MDVITMKEQPKETPLPKMGFRCATSGDPRIPWSVFYGYNSVDDGPGPDAFQKCLALSRQSEAPMLVLFGQNSCPTCKSFVEYVNAYDNGIGTMLGHSGAVNCYFCMNSAGTLPAAGVDAMQTVQRFLAGTPVAHHVMYVCGEFADGTTYCKPIQVVNDWQSLFRQIKSLVQEYKTLYEQRGGGGGSGGGGGGGEMDNRDYGGDGQYKGSARRCRKFETDVLDRPELAAWLAEQDCLLLYFRSEDGKWDSGDAKLFADTFGAGGGDVPMVRVWCDGKTYMKETF